MSKVVFDLAQQMWRQCESTHARFRLRRADVAAAGDIVDAALYGDCAVQEIEVLPF
jgi:DNA-binding protein YbaB